MSEGLRYISCLLDTNAHSELFRLRESVFLEDELEVLQFVKSHYRRYKQLPDYKTVEDQIRVRLPEVREPLDFYEQALAARAKTNIVVDMIKELKTPVIARDTGRMEAILYSGLSELGNIGARPDLINGVQAAERMMDRYYEAQRNPGISGIRSGYPTLDRATGGFQDTDLVAIVGRIGESKSWQLIKFADTAHREGYTSLVISMEMPPDQIMRRVIGLRTGIDPKFIKKGQLSTHNQNLIKRIAREDLRDFWIVSGNMRKSLSDVEATIDRIRPDIVFIDGIYLLSPTDAQQRSRYAKRAEKTEIISGELRAMSLNIGRPIIYTSQFNRQAGSNGRHGSLENIGYSDAIGQDSTMVIAVEPGKAPNASNTKIIRSLKGRDGEDFSFAADFSFQPLTMKELGPVVRGKVGRDTAAGADYNLDWTE